MLDKLNNPAHQRNISTSVFLRHFVLMREKVIQKVIYC